MSDETTAAPAAAPSTIPAIVVPDKADRATARIESAAIGPDERLRLNQQALRTICVSCVGAIHMGPAGVLGCCRLVRETEIADANSRKSEEEKQSVREALFLPDRPDQVKTYDKRACPVLKAWDQLGTAEPEPAKVLDNTIKFLASAGAPPLSTT